jgi:ion channel-forming bestrophin family protein
MIVRPRANLRDIMFAARGSIFGHVAWRVLLVTALSCATVYWTRFHRDPLAELGAAPFTFIGVSISIFMSFRNSTCYERWWEGRRLWGQLIISARSLARETVLLRDDPVRARILRGVCGFTYALAARLRGLDETEAAAPWLERHSELLANQPNVTNAILTKIGEEISELAEQGRISDWRYTVLEARLVELGGVQAGCERIKSTPLPYAYTLLIHRTNYLFCFLLPFGLSQELGWATPLLVAVVSYAFFGLDALGDELEDPFGHDENDLPLMAMARTVERDQLAALGVKNLPEPLAPVDFVLE